MNVKCLSDVVLSIYVIESGRISARMEIPPSLREPALVCDNSHWEKKKKKFIYIRLEFPVFQFCLLRLLFSLCFSEKSSFPSFLNPLLSCR